MFDLILRGGRVLDGTGNVDVLADVAVEGERIAAVGRLGSAEAREIVDVTGLTVCFATQTFINLGMTLGVAPITGLTLPFVSYGGSSLLTCALAAGVVLNVGARWQPAFSARDMAGGSIAISGFQPQAVKWLNQ